MRNLKRVLSLALAALMLMGMMVVGAGAAGIDDFSDKDEIVNKDAVSMLTILGVINGKEDGSYYAPQDNVTRAEMAKMIAIILNQGADVNDLYADLNTGLTDIDNSWAKGYINYCYSLGIIAGRGDGRFDPTAPVTGNEAAKMLLVAIGYDPDIEGLTGSAWAIKTTALASTLGIFDDMTAPTQDNLSRDNAALLIYNALDVEMVQKYEDGYAVVFDDSRTLLSTKYGVYKVTGVVTANKWAKLESTNSEAAAQNGKTTLNDVVVYSSTTSNTTVAEGVRETNPVTFSVDTPVEYMGKAVTMYIKKTTILANSTVLGVTLNEEGNTVHTNAASVADESKLLKGTGLSVNADTEYYVNYGICNNQADAIAQINEYANLDLNLTGKDAMSNIALNGIPVEVIDNDQDGVAEYVLYTVETMSLVRSYNTNQEIMALYTYERDASGKALNKASYFSVDFEDVVFEDEVAADDMVLYVQYGGRTYVKLAEYVTGKMSRVDRDKDDELYITLNGEEYRQSFIPETASKVDAEVSHFDIRKANTLPGFDTEYHFYLDSNGYVAAIRPAEEVSINYGLVLGSAWTQNALTKSGEIKILKTDGTEKKYTLDWDGCWGTGDAFANETDLENYLGSRDVVNSGSTYLTGAAAGSVIVYTLNDAEDTLTIEKVLKTHKAANLSSGYVTGNTENIGDGTGDIVYAAANAAAAISGENMQWTLASKYTKGDASMKLAMTGVTTDITYAIDKQTVAFYYEDADNYGVAVGWDNMGTVDTTSTVNVQVFPVEKKTTDGSWEVTKLAEVVVLDQAPEISSRDYMLVLGLNAQTTSSNLWLNVVFEDGTTKEIEIDSTGSYDFDNVNSYQKAYAYVENADGTYDIVAGTQIGESDADLLRVDTVDQSGVYFALPEDANVWDVTGMNSANDATKEGKFYFNIDVNAVIIPTTVGGRTIRTAFVWDIEADETDPDTSTDFGDYFTATANIYEYGMATVSVTANRPEWLDYDASNTLDYSFDIYVNGKLYETGVNGSIARNADKATLNWTNKNVANDFLFRPIKDGDKVTVENFKWTNLNAQTYKVKYVDQNGQALDASLFTAADAVLDNSGDTLAFNLNDKKVTGTADYKVIGLSTGSSGSYAYVTGTATAGSATSDSVAAGKIKQVVDVKTLKDLENYVYVQIDTSMLGSYTGPWTIAADVNVDEFTPGNVTAGTRGTMGATDGALWISVKVANGASVANGSKYDTKNIQVALRDNSGAAAFTDAYSYRVTIDGIGSAVLTQKSSWATLSSKLIDVTGNIQITKDMITIEKVEDKQDIVGATWTGNTVTVTFAEEFDTASVTAIEAWTASNVTFAAGTPGGNTAALYDVSASGNTVTLTFSGTLQAGNKITLASVGSDVDGSTGNNCDATQNVITLGTGNSATVAAS